MQITVVLEKDRIELPIAANDVIQGLIYCALSSDGSYSKKVHEEGVVFAGRKYKLFTFGEFKGKYEIEGKSIIYISKLQLEVRSVDSYMIQLLLLHFLNNKFIHLRNNTVAVKDVLISDRHIFQNCVKITTLSPIAVYVTESNGHTVYFSPLNEQFYSGIVANACRKWASYTGSADGFSLEIYPDVNTKFIKRATKFKDTFITAWHGRFILNGPPQVLDFLYQTGLGSKNSQGFGMFEVIG